MQSAFAAPPTDPPATELEHGRPFLALGAFCLMVGCMFPWSAIWWMMVASLCFTSWAAIDSAHQQFPLSCAHRYLLLTTGVLGAITYYVATRGRTALPRALFAFAGVVFLQCAGLIVSGVLWTRLLVP